MRVAVLHHWFVTRGGGERVAECIAALFPQADLFTLLSRESAIPASMSRRPMHTSVLQRMPGATRMHRHLLPLYPAATRSLDLSAYDLVVSSDAGPVKGVTLREGALQICYCHSPMRYLYDGYEVYRKGMNPFVRAGFTRAVPEVRQFDLDAAQKVHTFVSNSYYVAERIQRLYKRESTVVYPPIEMSLARTNTPGTHYLCAGRLVGYKRTDLMIEACERLGRPLRVVGSGPEMRRLRKLAGPNTTFLGELSQKALWEEYSRCRALLFAADEDFGMVPLEVQACGRPVIAFGFGGSLETVRAENPPTLYARYDAADYALAHAAPTGMYFSPQTADALMKTIRKFEGEVDRFQPETAQAFAAQFDTPIFLRGLRDAVTAAVPDAAREMAEVNTALATLQGGVQLASS